MTLRILSLENNSLRSQIIKNMMVITFISLNFIIHNILPIILKQIRENLKLKFQNVGL